MYEVNIIQTEEKANLKPMVNYFANLILEKHKREFGKKTDQHEKK